MYGAGPFKVNVAQSDKNSRLGEVHEIDPTALLKGTTMLAGLGLKEVYDLLGAGDVPMCKWEVVFCKVGSAGVTAGDLVTHLAENSIADGTGTTSTWVDSGLSSVVADYWKGAVLRLSKDVTTSGAAEGSTSIVKSNTAAGVLTFDPVWAGAPVATDVGDLLHPFVIRQNAALELPIGIALATGTVGQYMWVLKKGLALNGKVVGDDVYVIGEAMSTGASGAFAIRAGDTQCVAGHAAVAKDTDDGSAIHPVWLDL